MGACSSGASSHGAAGSGTGANDSEGSITGIPRALFNIENIAESAYEKALLADFSAVADDAKNIGSAWETFRSAAKGKGADATLLGDFDVSVTALLTVSTSSKDVAEVARAANAVSYSMGDLYALYHPIVPVEVMMLDYQERELVLDGMEIDWVEAAADLTAVKAIWAKLKPTLAANSDGAKSGDDYDRSLAAVVRDLEQKDGARLILDANKGLDLVDAMGTVFK
jgi:hypothetical protein